MTLFKPIEIMISRLAVLKVYLVLVEMSSSWNFPARASPSYEGSEPSRAGAL